MAAVVSGQKFGRSLYYATDKNIFDALNQHKVDSSTVVGLFESRNTIVSGSAPRKWLAEYFSTLNHDYYDHQAIAGRLGVVPRRERVTSMEVLGVRSFDDLLDAIQKTKLELEDHGDVVTTVRKNDRVVLRVQYSVVDFRRSEFNQVQVRDGEVEFQREGDGYIVRNTQNEYVNNVRDLVLASVPAQSEKGLTRQVVSLYAVPDSETRSSFFYDLFSGLPGYTLRDVTDVYVFQPGQTELIETDSDDPHVERVSFKGTGVTQSEYLARLAKDGYYIVKVGWRCREVFGKGDEFAIEALFTNPAECTGFSYILLGVHDNVDGSVSIARRAPTKVEIAIISKAIESRARELMKSISSNLSGTVGV